MNDDLALPAGGWVLRNGVRRFVPTDHTVVVPDAFDLTAPAPRTLKPCGTDAAYRRHLRRRAEGEPPCVECLSAASAKRRHGRRVA